MPGHTRRDVLALAGRGLAAAFVLQLPQTMYREPWTSRARAALPTVEPTFVALVEAVTDDPDAATARWIVAEFDKALPPVPGPATSAVVAAVLDARSVTTVGKPFAVATPGERRDVLAAMVRDPSPDIRQVANQVLPFTGFAYWSDATLGEPARPEGPDLPRWQRVGFPGPSHSYLDTYTDGGPPGFRAARNFER